MPQSPAPGSRYIEQMNPFKSAILFSLILCGLAACGSTAIDGQRPVSAQYCDNFMIYDMCARDTNRDGEVDYVYFTDTNEVFMYRQGLRRMPRDLGRHRCALEMDPELVATTSRLFYIDDDTSFLEKQDIRGSMMIKYIAYMPRVTACNMRAEQDQQTAGS